jgi:hypothetical protein
MGLVELRTLGATSNSGGVPRQDSIQLHAPNMANKSCKVEQLWPKFVYFG